MRRRRFRAMLLLLALGGLAPPALAQTAAPVPSDEARRIGMIERASASVVQLTATQPPRDRGDFALGYTGKKECDKLPTARWDDATKQCRMPFSPPPRPEIEIGTGVLFDAERGLFLTAEHIVNAGSLQARLPDGRTVTATLRATDPHTGLAVVAVDPAELRATAMVALPLSREPLKSGQDVLLVGRSAPLDTTLAITGRVVGTQGPEPVGGNDTMPLGARLHVLDIHLPDGTLGGGPVIDARGAVAGIVLAIYGANGGQTVTIMIGLDTLQADIARLSAGETIARGWLGLNLRCTDGVCTIENVEPDTPAGASGLRGGDILVTANGTALANDLTLARMVRAAPPGTPFTLAVTRDGVPMTLTVTSIDAAAAPPRPRFPTIPR